MAIVRVIPSDILVVLDKNVAIPSGILWAMMANMLNIPTLYNFLSLTLLFSGINLSINNDIVMPSSIPTIMYKKQVFLLLCLINKFMLSGIKSNIDTLIITPDAKANEYLVNLSMLHLMNIKSAPIIVERPAIVVNVKDINN